MITGHGLIAAAPWAITIGFYYFDSGEGGTGSYGHPLGFMSLLAVFQGDSILLGISNARKISKQDKSPPVINVVEEMGHRLRISQNSRISTSSTTRR
jgi:hypothetical protein